MSQWLNVLRTECKRTSQAKVAATLGYSATTISQVLNGSYPGNLEKFRATVEGALMGVTVDCPVIGEIPRNRCIDHQNRRQFAATNPLRVQLHGVCPDCTNSKHGGDK